MPRDSTLQLCRFAAALTLDDLPGAAKAAARWGLLDAVACAIAGRDEPVATASRAWVTADGAGGVTLWGTPQTASASSAALANGAAAHALDFDDVCWAMNAHPSVVLAPAILAAAERHGRSGSDVLRAYAVGFEVAARIGESLGHAHYAAGFHPTATIGTLGAAAAVSSLLGHDASTMATALGIAGSSAAGTRLNFGTDTKPLHAGLAARAGLTAAELAHAGVSSRRDVLEAPMGVVALYRGERAHVRTDLDRLALLDPGLEHKPYPCCRFTHRVIEATGRLRARHPDAAPTLIRCHVDPFSREILIYDQAVTGLEAKFSMQVAAALTWLDGEPTVASFDDARVRTEEVRDLASRVRLEDGSREEERVTVVLDDGSTDTESVSLPLGHPQRPLGRDRHVEKVHLCADAALGAPRVDALVERFENVEHVGQASELTGLLVPPVGLGGAASGYDPAR